MSVPEMSSFDVSISDVSTPDVSISSVSIPDVSVFDVCIYHSPCSDGLASAWVFWNENKSITLIGAKHGDKIPKNLENKNVVIVDFSYPKEQLLQIVDQAKFTLLLDHHKSVERDLKDVVHPRLEIVFDMTRCGAQIAYDRINTKTKKRHFMIEVIADRDLWLWKLPYSKAVGKATYELGYHASVIKFDELMQLNPDDGYMKFVELGNILLENESSKIKSYVDRANICHFQTSIGTYTVGVTNAPYEIRSEVGNQIATKLPVDFALMYQYNFLTDEYWLSFRGVDNEDKKLDISVIAKTLPNGGGHPKACGATIYGSKSNPPEKYESFKGENMYTYLTPFSKEELAVFSTKKSFNKLI